LSYKRHNTLSVVIMCYKLLLHGNFHVDYHVTRCAQYIVSEGIMRQSGASCYHENKI